MPFRIALERRPAPPATHLLEIVTPRTNAATITPAENLLASLALREPFALELAADSDARRFFVRAGSVAMAGHLRSLLRAPYPQARLVARDPRADPRCDPARRVAGEQVAARVLVLAAPDYLPLRSFRDGDVDADRAAAADPVLGILGALADLPRGWRALTQLVLAPAPRGWSTGYARLALERPLASERAGAGESLVGPLLLAGAVAALAAGWQAWQWWVVRDWAHLTPLAAALLAAPAVAVVLRRALARPPYDPALVAEKIARPAFTAQLRLAVFAPPGTPLAALTARLDRLVAAYGQFDHHAGNRLVSRPLRLAPAPPGDDPPQELRSLAFLPPARARALLNTREAAGLWHLPQAGADVALLERTGARSRVPLPATVAEGCHVGVADDGQGTVVPVALSDGLLRRHLLLVGKTRRGKSSLMLHVFRHLTAPRRDLGLRSPTTPGMAHPAVVLVDPHRDLARAALALVPPSRHDEVVFLDVAATERPFGLNLLDTGLGWGRDGAVENTLLIFRRQFHEYWGPRMEDAYRFGLLTLYAANEALVGSDPRGPAAARGAQHTILELPALYADRAFRSALLDRLGDPVIRAWWDDYFSPLDRRVQLEIVNPVLTKINRYAGSTAARAIVGQPRSTLDPHAWLREGRLVIVDGASGAVGEDTAALICGALVNLLKLAIAGQIDRDPTARRPVTLICDEFHSVPGADYEAILAELGKFGANLILATQSLERLDTLDRGGARALRATVFANLDGLFAFNVSAADARYLVPELGGEDVVAIEDLTALEDYRCYARISRGGRRLPTFLLSLAPPPATLAGAAGALALRAGGRVGRPRALVEADLAAARARIALTHGKAAGAGAGAGQGGATVAPGATEVAGTPPAGGKGRKKGAGGRRARQNEARHAGQRALWEPRGREDQEATS